MTAVEFRTLLEQGDIDSVREALESDPALADRTIHWHLNQDNQTDPLHYLSDCVANGWLTNGAEGELARLLLSHGASLNGTPGRESPLIAAASLGADKVAAVLVAAGADLELTSLFDARALHWAAWTGAAEVVRLLLDAGAEIEVKCTEFGATPLFWAVHGYGPRGPRQKTDQVAAARLLLERGAEVRTANKEGLFAVELARECANTDMSELLDQYAA